MALCLVVGIVLSGLAYEPSIDPAYQIGKLKLRGEVTYDSYKLYCPISFPTRKYPVAGVSCLWVYSYRQCLAHGKGHLTSSNIRRMMRSMSSSRKLIRFVATGHT